MKTLITGLVLILMAQIIRHVVGRRVFYRTNQAGVQEFRSYGSKVMSQSGEALLGLLAVIGRVLGVLLVLAGLLVWHSSAPHPHRHGAPDQVSPAAGGASR